MRILDNIDTLIKEAKDYHKVATKMMLTNDKHTNLKFLRANPNFKEIGTGPTGALFQHKDGSIYDHMGKTAENKEEYDNVVVGNK